MRLNRLKINYVAKDKDNNGTDKTHDNFYHWNYIASLNWNLLEKYNENPDEITKIKNIK